MATDGDSSCRHATHDGRWLTNHDSPQAAEAEKTERHAQQGQAGGLGRGRDAVGQHDARRVAVNCR